MSRPKPIIVLQELSSTADGDHCDKEREFHWRFRYPKSAILQADFVNLS